MADLFAITGMLLTGNYDLPERVGFVILVHSMPAPSKFKIAIPLQLSETTATIL